MRAQFVDLDDTNILINNPFFRGLRVANLHWMFFDSLYIGNYMPLSWVTLAVDYLLWGMNPFGYHLTNLLLHVGNALLFYVLMSTLFKIISFQTTEPKPWHAASAAALSALFFGIHPLRVESVAWIVERRDVLSGLFFLLTLFAYLRYTHPPVLRRKWAWYIAFLALYALCLLSKATGITMVVLLLLLDNYPLNRLDRNAWFEKIPVLLLGVIFTLIAAQAQIQSTAAWRLQDLGILDRAAIMSYGYGFYLRKTLLPLHLYPIRELFLPIHWSDPTFYLSGLLVLGLTWVFAWKRRHWPTLWTLWCAYLVLLLPMSGIFQSGPQLVAERYSYLSCLGWAALFGYGVVHGYARLSSTQWRSLYAVSVSVVLVFLGVLTCRQSRIWYNAETLYLHVAREDPTSIIARTTLGNILIARGQTEEGARYLSEAFRAKPNTTSAYNLAIGFERLGQFENAVPLYDFVIRTNPSFVQAYNNLGQIYRRTGRLPLAIRTFQSALRVKDIPELHYNLGLAYQDQKQWKDALAEFDRALLQRPDFSEVQKSKVWLVSQHKTP